MVEELESVVVRDAELIDVLTISRIHTLSWQQAYAGYVPADYLNSLDPQDKVPVWQTVLSRDDTQVFIAESAGRALGFASVGPSPDEDAEPGDRTLYTMYLDPEAWGLGVAKLLMQAVDETVPEGVSLTLWVFEKNLRARKFYERHNFKYDNVEKLEEFGGEHLLEVRYRK
ncbi:GNAT family N-acetyltransferase [Populibacterium corticicola]|jgi:GNAT superfamily N-acetyltransferase|uniref:GNAT family N-acetyltransferase n=1 Tax=Populibacterium corticicola TaxID=1812826 RepID=A0ABW5XB93_9MICO